MPLQGRFVRVGKEKQKREKRALELEHAVHRDVA